MRRMRSLTTQLRPSLQLPLFRRRRFVTPHSLKKTAQIPLFIAMAANKRPYRSSVLSTIMRPSPAKSSAFHAAISSTSLVARMIQIGMRRATLHCPTPVA